MVAGPSTAYFFTSMFTYTHPNMREYLQYFRTAGVNHFFSDLNLFMLVIFILLLLLLNIFVLLYFNNNGAATNTKNLTDVFIINQIYIYFLPLIYHISPEIYLLTAYTWWDLYNNIFLSSHFTIRLK